ncbi:MAG TPA: S9 family peptidase [Candidatus Eisenbacteria bacterium]|nr:S9 family peptidase [Candidatus Eisenbacteria bacterium]
MQTRRPLKPEDLFDLKFVDAVTLSPDGASAVYQVRTIDVENDKYQSHLWLVPLQGGEPRRITFGEHRNGGAAFSPDGRWLAFTSDRKDKKAQIYRLPLDGGEAERLTDLDGSLSGLAYSPDGSKISFVYTPNDPVETGHLPGSVPLKKATEARAEKKDLPAKTFMHIKTMRYKFDGQGFLPQAHAHIHLLDLATREVRALTSGTADHDAPVWSPDGKWLAFSANRHPDNDYNYYIEMDVWVMPAEGGEPRNLTPQPGVAMSPVWSPDGSTIAFLGHQQKDDWWGWWNAHLWTVPMKGGEPTDLMKDVDTMGLDVMGSDLSDFHGSMRPIWSRDGSAIYFPVSEGGSVPLCSLPAKGGKLERLTSGAHRIADGCGAKGSDDLVVLMQGHKDAGTIARFSPKTRTITPLAEPNRALFDQLTIVEPEELWVTSPKGHKVQAWVLKPPGADPKAKHPAILEIHGGPRVQWGACYFHEFQMFANAGYYVIFSNPRGALGYGEAHSQAIVKDWAGPAYDDLMMVVDGALKQHPEIDPARLGVTGGSYGGYMTNWIVGHTDRFRAALTQRSVVTISTLLLASDDLGGSSLEFGDEPWHMTSEILWKQSPLAYAENVKTPLMITHSLQDFRCAISEAEILYKTLKALRKEVELVLFPGESHGLSRGGTPSRRLARLHIMRDWFHRHLVDGSPKKAEPKSEAAMAAVR